MKYKNTILTLSSLLVSMVLVTGCSVEKKDNDDKANTTETVISDDQYSLFAQCLADSGAKMYGAFWCNHCEEQLDMFGYDQKNPGPVPYVECSNEDRSPTTACIEAGITSYPTWIFDDGTRVEGRQPFSELSKLSGCNI